MQKWEAFLQHLRSVLGSLAVETWLKGVRVLKFDAYNLHLEIRDEFQIHWFREHVNPLAQRQFKWGERPIRIHINSHLPIPPKGKQMGAVPRAIHPTWEAFGEPLSDFEPTQGQELAYRLLEQICGEGDRQIALATFNPLFFHGPSGSGKTRLLKAFAAELSSKSKRVIALDGEAFTQDVVGAIRRGEMSSFRERYRSADVLIVDGVEKLGKKSATQEEFFHTFNALHIAGKQIALSAPHPPQELQAIEQRLISRFEWGIELPLQMPSATEQQAIAQRRAEQLSLQLQGPDLQRLLMSLEGNLKHLGEALETLAYQRDLREESHRGAHFDANAHLPKILRGFHSKRATPEAIIEQVASHFGVLSADILGRSQSREFTRPRRLAMYLCRSELQLSFVKIGEIFQRDHSTVMSNCRNIKLSLDAKTPLPDLQEVSLRLRRLRF